MSFLPTHPGLLPKWQLLVAVVAVLNSFQNFLTVEFTRRVYSNKPEQVTGLCSRTFGTWTLLSGIIRLYCAYHIDEKAVYDITIWTYVVVLFHFGSEWLHFRTSNLGAGLYGPLIVGTTSLTWMLAQYSFYVKP